MNEPRAITANLVDVKNVNTHKCVRLIIDVPAEQATAIIDMFGWPTMVNPVPVAVARLHIEAVRKRAGRLSATDKRTWDDLPLSQQAAIRCGEISFRRFLAEEIEQTEGIAVYDGDMAADVVRQFCGVSSRRQIAETAETSAKWVELDTRYQVWMRAA